MQLSTCLSYFTDRKMKKVKYPQSALYKYSPSGKMEPKYLCSRDPVTRKNVFAVYAYFKTIFLKMLKYIELLFWCLYSTGKS